MLASLMGLALLCSAEMAAAQEGNSDAIVVTGTRIPQVNRKSTSPIQVITDQEFKLQGTSEAGDLLNQLPQIANQAGIDFTNTPNPLSGPGGVTTANLRGLGPQRTLVLIDGVRLGTGDSNAGNPNPAPDLDQIPGALVQRVEVVTGGASAVYGSDAVAGVVNFIMKKDFEGFQVDARYGFAQHKNDNTHIQDILKAANLPAPSGSVRDGDNGDISVTMGASSADGKGNVTAYLGWHRQRPISQARRDFSGCLLASTGDDFDCANSSNSNRFTNAATGARFAVVNNTFLPWPVATSVPPPTFNSSPYQYLSRDDTRYTAGFFAHYDINSAVNLYSQLMFMDDRTTTQVAPTAIFQQNGVYNVNCDNPLLSTQQATAIGCVGAGGARLTSNAGLVIGRRWIEGGPRQSFYEHQSYRMLFGSKGDLNENWSYNAYAQYYYATIEQFYLNDLDKSKIVKALQVVNVAGVPTCKAKVDGSDPSCVPLSLFTQGAINDAQIGYVGAFGTAWGSTEQQIVSGTLTGNLGALKSPGATDPIGVAFGAEYRREAATYTPDTLWQSGNLTGAGGATPATKGVYDVNELFAEIQAPLVQGASFADELSVDAGYRWSDYSNAGNTHTYKGGLQWAPTADGRFRLSYQRAVRAPNLTELFVPRYVTNSAVLTSDPCAGPAPTATFAQCARTGVTAAQWGNGTTTNLVLECPAGQCSVQQGGNPFVKPEFSDTYSAGLVLSPRFIAGLTGSVDWWSIRQKEVINTIPATTTFNNCLTTGDPVFCSRVVRTPQGYLFGDTIQGGGFVNTPLENLASTKTAGVDAQLNYTHELGYGSLAASMYGSYLIHAKTKTDPASEEYNCAGLFGPTCITVQPKWRHTMRVSWDMPIHVMASLQWRYIGSSKLDANSDEPVLGVGLGDNANAKLKAVSYFDLSGTWEFNEKFSFRAGVNNILDKSPQVISAGDISGVGGPNAYPTYDLLGRTFFMGVTATF
jgi:outer membrane receptor protein involved in Fe transport